MSLDRDTDTSGGGQDSMNSSAQGGSLGAVGNSANSSTLSFKRPNIQPPSNFHVSNEPSEDWKMWKQLWENYCVLTNLGSQDEGYQKALLLHSLGPEGVRIYNGMSFSVDEDSNKASVIISKLDSHFLGARREYFERFKFNRRNQALDETIDQYVSVLRTMAKTCGFCKCMAENLLMDRLLLGVCDDKMRERMMATHDLTLNKAVDICKAMEAANCQMTALRKDTVHRVTGRNVTKGQSTQKFVKQSKAKKMTGKSSAVGERKCKFCCRAHVMKKENCPAWGKKCKACHQSNHFKGSVLCKAKDVHAVGEEEEDLSSAESVSFVTVQNVNAVSADKQPIICNMIVNDRSVAFQVDCGATVCLLPEKFLTSSDTLRDDKVCLQMWNHSTMRAKGRCKVTTRNPATQKKYHVDYVIVEEDLMPLLSKTAAEKMGIITVNYDSIESVHFTRQEDLVKEYPDVFSSSSVGLLSGGEVHLLVEENAQPVIRPSRTVPESLKSAVKAELDSLQHRGVIEVVQKPTDWVNQMSIAQKKSGKVRICLDPRPLNEVLKREHYPLPVLDSILPELSKARLFSVCDLKDGYLHCVLDENSSLLTTFATPWGRYRWKRLPFGLKVSSEIFQKRLHQTLEGLDGVRCVADDIIVWGSDEVEHNTRLHKLLKRCHDVGIVLNKEKCKFGVKEIVFLGHIVSSAGLKPDPSKIEAILEMSAPTSKDDIDRLRGMVNYLARYLPKLADVMQPLNELSHKNVAWTWDAVHDEAYRKLKELLTKAPVLTYYDQSKELVVHTDASAQGLGAVMMQGGKPIAYASRALREAELRYSVIEKEMLAIVFALEKWNQFTFGREVKVYTDHKPLASISKKPLDRAPKRLQGMLLRAMAYDIDVQYLRGKDNYVADPLSRAYLPQKKGQESLERVSSITHLSLPDEEILEMRECTAEDESLQALKQTILNGWPEQKNQLSPLVTPYFSVRDELTVVDGIVFRGERLVVPKKMRQKVKADLHVGHSGVDGTLRRAREYVYWPGMSQEIREWIQTCETCMEYSSAQSPQPLMSHDVPDRPWEKIGVDLLSLDGKEYLVTVCYQSNFWELDKLYKTTAKVVTSKLSSHFARYGIPDTMVTDNGPPFSSREFDSFVKELGIKHQTISPYNSKANGKAEAAVKAAKKLLKRCQSSGEDENLALLNVRNTPSQGVDSSPAQRFLGRRTKMKIPTTQSLLQPKRHESKHERQQLELNKKRQAKYFDKHAKELPELAEGDVVRMKPFRPGEDRWRKAVVIRRLDERSYEVDHNGAIYRRNREHLRASREHRDPENSVLVTSRPETDLRTEGIQSSTNPGAKPHHPEDAVLVTSRPETDHHAEGLRSPTSPSAQKDASPSSSRRASRRSRADTQSHSRDQPRSRDALDKVSSDVTSAREELPGVPVRRSTRQRRVPEKLQDFVLH